MVMVIMTYLWAFCGFFSHPLLLLLSSTIVLMLEDFRVVSVCSTFRPRSTVSSFPTSIDWLNSFFSFPVQIFDMSRTQTVDLNERTFRLSVLSIHAIVILLLLYRSKSVMEMTIKKETVETIRSQSSSTWTKVCECNTLASKLTSISSVKNYPTWSYSEIKSNDR